MAQDETTGPESGASPPPGYKLVYQGDGLPAFYADEMLRPLIGKTVWMRDVAGRTRQGRLTEVPWLKEDQNRDVPPVVFEDARPFYLKQIVCVAVYGGAEETKG